MAVNQMKLKEQTDTVYDAVETALNQEIDAQNSTYEQRVSEDLDLIRDAALPADTPTQQDVPEGEKKEAEESSLEGMSFNTDDALKIESSPLDLDAGSFPIETFKDVNILERDYSYLESTEEPAAAISALPGTEAVQADISVNQAEITGADLAIEATGSGDIPVQPSAKIAPEPLAPPVQKNQPVKPPNPARSNSAKRRERTSPFSERKPVPANDDRIGAPVQVTRRKIKASRMPYALAAIGSIIWSGGIFFLLNSIFATSELSGIGALSSTLNGGSLALAIMGLSFPVLFFFVVALMLVRSNEMKYVAHTINDVATKLSQPEQFSTDAVLSISQAVRREVSAIGDGVERALARASELETLVRSEISTLERAYSDNEIRIRSLIDELVTQRESIIMNAERAGAAISGTHQNLANDLENAADRVVNAMISAGDKVTNALESRGETITVSLGHAGEKIISDMAERGIELVERLATRSNAIKSDIASVGDTITASLEEKSKEIKETFEASGNNLVDALVVQGSEIRASFETTARVIENSFAERGIEMASRLTQTGQDIADSIVLQSEIACEQMGKTGNNIGVQVNQVGQEIQIHLEDLVTKTKDTFGTRVESLADRLEAASQRVNDSVTVHGDTLEEKLTSIANNVVETVGSSIEKMQSSIDVRGQDFSNILDTHILSVFNRMEDAENRFVSSISAHTDNVSSSMSRVMEAFKGTLDLRSEALAKMLSSNLADFASSISKGSEISDRLSNDLVTLSATLNTSLEELDRTITVHGKNLTDSLSDKTKTAMESAKTQLSNVEQHMSKRATELTQSFDSLITRIDDALDSRAEALNEAIVVRTSEMARIMAEGGREVANALEARVEQIGKTLSYKSDTLGQNLMSKAEEINRVLGHRAQEISDNMDLSAGAFEERILVPLTTITTNLDQRSQSLSSELAERMTSLSDIFDTKGRSLIADIDKNLTAANQLFNVSNNTLLENLHSRIGDIADAFEGGSEKISVKLGDHVSTMSDLLDQRAGLILSSLGERLAQVNTLFATEGAALIESVEKRSHDFAELYADSCQALGTSVEIGAEKAVTMLLSTNDRIRGEIAGVLDRVHEANQLLQHVVSSASGNLSSVESNLAGRVEQIDALLSIVANQTGRATEKISEQVEALHTVASGVMRQATTLATALDERSHNLSEATHNQIDAMTHIMEDFESLERRLGQTLTQRQDNLEQLLNNISEKSVDIQSITQSLEGLVENSLSTTETQSREINALIQRTAEMTTQTISQQFDLVRHATNEESQHTAEILREAYMDAAKEMTQALGSATVEFRNSLSSLKNMAQQIKAELDNTRNEIQQGMVQLPEEAAETTANMRRVVSDQIKALNELSSLISKTGHNKDAALSSSVSGASQSYSAISAVPAVTAYMPPKDSDDAVAPVQPDYMQKPVNVAPIPPRTFPERKTQRSSNIAGLPPRPAPARQPSAKPAVAARPVLNEKDDIAPFMRKERTENPSGSSWISDLLDRASRDETPVEKELLNDHNRMNALDILDAISADIQQLINNQAITELWDKYRRGEKNLFSRHLYSKRGLQVFDEIAERYDTDTDFRSVIERYIEEFEKKLLEIGENDPDMKIAQGYLISDSGKVYTLLAHASGRFRNS